MTTVRNRTIRTSRTSRTTAVLATLGLVTASLVVGWAEPAAAVRLPGSNIYVGYAYDKNPPTFFPSPWQGDANVNFVGLRGEAYDGGAIRIDNPTGSPITVEKVTVTIGTKFFDIWPSNMVVPPKAGGVDGKLIITQMGPETFDTSEADAGPCDAPNSIKPVIDITVGGETSGYLDVNQILNTGGRDSGGCPLGTNESLQWLALETAVNPAPSVNLAPTIVATDQSIAFREALVFTVATADAEGDPRVITARGLPGASRLTDNGNGTATVAVPPGTAPGSYPVTFWVQDPFHAPVGVSVTLTVGPPAGYWLTATDGGIFAFGSADFFGSTGDIVLNRPVVGMTATPTGNGYWFVASDGGIFSYGDAEFFGSTGDLRLNKPVVGMASTPSGKGYWLVASDGGIFSFGDAPFYGSTGNLTLNQPVVGMAATPTGGGYWFVAADGGIFSFGDAQFYGSTGDLRLNRPVVGMAATPSSQGYWFVASDGGIFSFGDAGFFGSTPSLAAPVVGMAAASQTGYWMVGADGAVFPFGDAGFFGSMRGTPLNKPVVGMAV